MHRLMCLASTKMQRVIMERIASKHSNFHDSSSFMENQLIPQPHTVDLFTEVAPKYEFLNGLMTARMDKKWRKVMLRFSEAALGRKPDLALDLATGTGDIARLMIQRWPQARVIGTDPTPAMLDIAKLSSTHPKHGKIFAKIEWNLGAAEALEFETNSVDLITIAFGFRNVGVELRARAVSEAYRVLKPGGVLAILELGIPQREPFQQIYRLLLKHGMPRFAGLFAPKEPYAYLAESILSFPPPDQVRKILSKPGFLAFAPRSLSGGMAWLYLSKKPIQKN